MDPQPGDVFVLDWNNQVVSRATIDHLGTVPYDAQTLGKTIYRWRVPNGDLQNTGDRP